MVVSQTESSLKTECGACESVLQKVYASRSSYGFTEREVSLIEQSYSASDEEQYAYSREKMERLVNGEIVTDSESDNPDLYSKDQQKVLRKKIEAIKRSAKRRAAKGLPAGSTYSDLGHELIQTLELLLKLRTTMQRGC